MPILLISVTVLINGCSSVKDLQIFTKEVKRTPLNLDNPKPAKLDSIEWMVINSDNYKKIFEELEKGNKSVVLFGLTDDEYEKLAVNFAQVRKYIILNRSILEKYKEYYEGKDGTEETTKGQ